jgi:hypothetical protein
MQSKILQIAKYVFAAVSYLLLLAMATLFVQQIFAGFQKEDFGITEFLINYEGGFVRRGFIGTILLWLFRQFGITPYYPILAICISSFIGVVVLMIRFLRQQQLPIYLLGYCMFIGNSVFSYFWFRKDCLIICLFAVVVYLAKRSKYWIASMVLAIAILIHEEIFFFTLPFAIGLLLHHKRTAQSSLLLFTSLVTFITISICKGTVSMSNTIWESWSAVPFPYQDVQQVAPPSAIDGLGWSLLQGLKFNAQTWHNYNGHIWAPLAWVFILSLVLLSACNIHSLRIRYSYLAHKHNQFIQIVFIQIASIIPLFFIGWDYGRWVFLALCSTYVLSIFDIIPLQITFVETIVERCRKILAKPFFQSYYTNAFLLLALGIPGYSWGIIIYRHSNAVQQIISFFQKLL